jgi:Tol biopolymer transport system component
LFISFIFLTERSHYGERTDGGFSTGVDTIQNASHIYALSQSDKSVVQITDGTTTSDTMPCFSKDGTRILFARAHRIRPYSLGGWTADNYDAYIVFLSDRIERFAYDLYLMNSIGTNPVPLSITSISRYNQNPVFMPGGKSPLFLAGTSQNLGSRAIYCLWQVNSDGSNPRQIAGSGLFTNPLTWKPGT